MSSPQIQKEEFSRKFQVRKIPATGLSETLVATTEECQDLAKRLGIVSCADFRVTLAFKVHDEGTRVTAEGHMHAEVQQQCVVTLDPVRDVIDEPLSLLFLEESLIPEDDGTFDFDDLMNDEPFADPIRQGWFDAGAAVAEHLALALDPYPRRPDVEFMPPQQAEIDDVSTEKAKNPFAVLRALQDADDPVGDGNET